MQEALFRLFDVVTVLVFISHKCMSMPLRNNTNMHTNLKTNNSSENNFANFPSIHFNSTFKITATSESPQYVAEGKRAPMRAKEIVLPTTTHLGDHDNIIGKITVPHTDLTFKVFSADKWLKDFGHQSTFISVTSPLRQQAREIPSLAPVHRAAKARQENVEQQLQLRHLWPMVVGILVLIVVFLFFTVLWWKTHSLSSVRSAAVSYIRQVDKETKSNLSHVKAFLPMMAATKGIYGRVWISELHDVFSRMGEEAPHCMIESCFPADFTDAKTTTEPCPRIKLLTPEDIAKEDL
ncbi:hypothetical protein V3C99_015231 [Haemonchus contortus]